MTTAWVLRGGASFGAAQVGMARALIEAGHHPDMLYGTSAGALNASWLAADPTLEGLEELSRLWTMVRRRDVFPLRPWHALSGLAGWRDFTVSAVGLASWLRTTTLLRRLEDGVLPLTVVATDLENGQEVLLESGPAVPALLASSAMPGIFPPVRIGDRWLVDGSVGSDSPIGAAVRAGAGRVWLLPSAPTVPVPRPRGAFDVMLRSTAIALARQAEVAVATWASRCELFVLPAPLVPGVSAFSFTKSRELITSAYLLTQQWLEEAHPEPEL
ncbi:MAG: patatin-like phospholipase family protein [Acidimicrobiales bacterium]